MQAVLFVGIQGSGKSSFFKERFYSTHVRINRDMLKTAHREREFIETCLRTQQPFVIDKVNARSEQRAEYIRAAKAAQFRVVGYYFKCSTREAIARNQQRSGKEKIPVTGILSAYKQLEVPAVEEGFDELYCVTLNAQNQFTVELASDVNLTK
ncbi:MAG TPA: AAA family ATPase [Chthoniobacterales bacterium]|nr:AAA family ATPase [Chthoniobacterales bacterium]